MTDHAKSLLQNCYEGIELHDDIDDDGVNALRIITKSEYPGTHDNVVIRVRKRDELYEIDDNGEAAFYAGMQGGDADSGSTKEWAERQWSCKRIVLTGDGTLTCLVTLAQVSDYVHHMAMAARALFDVSMLAVDEVNS